MSRRGRGWSRWAVVALLFAACHFEASCGKKSLSMDDAKEYVASELSRVLGVKPDSVTCPSSVKAKKGETFECQAKFGDAVATIAMIQTSDTGDVHIQSVTGVVISDKLEALIVDMMDKQTHKHVNASCGARFRPAIAGGKLTCEATDDGGATYGFEIDIEDAQGTANVRLVSGPGVTPALAPEPPR